MSKILIEYEDRGHSAWTGRSVKKVEINGVEIDRVFSFELYVGADMITHIKLDMLVDQLSINPITRTVAADL